MWMCHHLSGFWWQAADTHSQQSCYKHADNQQHISIAQCDVCAAHEYQQDAPHCLSDVSVAVSQDRVKRVENCVNVQAQVPTDPTVKSFGLSIKGQMMEVRLILLSYCMRNAQMGIILHQQV